MRMLLSAEKNKPRSYTANSSTANASSCSASSSSKHFARREHSNAEHLGSASSYERKNPNHNQHHHHNDSLLYSAGSKYDQCSPSSGRRQNQQPSSTAEQQDLSAMLTKYTNRYFGEQLQQQQELRQQQQRDRQLVNNHVSLSVYTASSAEPPASIPSANAWSKCYEGAPNVELPIHCSPYAHNVRQQQQPLEPAGYMQQQRQRQQLHHTTVYHKSNQFKPTSTSASTTTIIQSPRATCIKIVCNADSNGGLLIDGHSARHSYNPSNKYCESSPTAAVSTAGALHQNFCSPIAKNSSNQYRYESRERTGESACSPYYRELDDDKIC